VRTITIPDEFVDTIREALSTAADQRKRVATRLASEAIDGPDAKADPRPDALRIARVLVDASRLETIADALEHAPEVENGAVDVRSAMFDAGWTPGQVVAALNAAEAAGADVATTPQDPPDDPETPAEDPAAPTAPAGLPPRTRATRAAPPPGAEPPDPPVTDDDVAEALEAMGMTDGEPEK
jgi:hypothetical protein